MSLLRGRWLGAEPAEWREPTGRRRDLRLALLCLAGGLAFMLLGVGENNGHPLYVRAAPLAVVCAALMLRRVAPVPAVVVGGIGVVAELVIGPALGTLLVFGQLSYDAALYGRREVLPWLLRVAVATTVVVTLALFLGGAGYGQTVAVAVTLALVFVLPPATAIPVRQHRERAQREQERARQERERAEQIGRLAEIDRREALVAERARVARELHDVVANHLSAVAIHATAAQSIADLDREKLADVLAVIRENSVQGLAEMRRLVEVLREAEESGARLAEVGRLLDGAAGLDVRLVETGERVPLPAAVDHAAYRIVQESLTNAAKHAAGGTATVRIGYRPGSVLVTVDSCAPGPPAQPSLDGAGMGLTGMRERAELLGGAFEAGPHGDGWRVQAELPL
jgi:signal transduction histidine kinase